MGMMPDTHPLWFALYSLPRTGAQIPGGTFLQKVFMSQNLIILEWYSVQFI